MVKSDGSWTYFASDIACHLDKFQRGSKTLIDVWGADHGGYVRRMKAATTAISEGQAALDVKICPDREADGQWRTDQDVQAGRDLRNFA